MGIIAWLVLGLIAGAVAKLIIPGGGPGGWLGALITGLLGALLGGFIASAVFGINVNDQFFDLGTWLFAIGGGALVALIWQLIVGRRGVKA